MAVSNSAGQGLYHPYSYSGSDAVAYMYLPGRGDKLVQIESMHTISWSVHYAKSPARALGFKGVRGFSYGPNTIAGSLIMTVIEDNPLAAVMDMMAEVYLDPALRLEGWSMDWRTNGVGSGLNNTTFNRRLAGTLPLLNVLVQYVAEGAQWSTPVTDAFSLSIPGAAVLLEGITFLDEGMVTSTSDSATETTYSFMALDCKTLSKQQFVQSFNAFTPEDPAMVMAGELEMEIMNPRDAQSYAYKSQTNPFANGNSFGSPNTANRVSK